MLTPKIIGLAESNVYGRAQRNISLSELSKWRIGGNCALLLEPESPDQVVKFVGDLFGTDIPYIVIGATSNLLFDDAGFPGICVRLGKNFSGVKIDGTKATVLAGSWAPAVARTTAKSGLKGLEHIVGIPGSMGGLITMNGGSQRRSISEHIGRVISVTPDGRIKKRVRNECEFSYRDSVFRKSNEIILAAEFDLEPDGVEGIRRRMLCTLRSRRQKFPLKDPNCGSVFVSTPTMYEEIGPPGKVIENLGLKGYSIGGAKVSELHANFFVNTGNATARDMLSLIQHVKLLVAKETGYVLRTEVLFVDSTGRVVPADEAEGS